MEDEKMEVTFYEKSIKLDQSIVDYFITKGYTHVKYYFGETYGIYRMYGKRSKEKNDFCMINRDSRHVSATSLLRLLNKQGLYEKRMVLKAIPRCDNGEHFIDIEVDKRKVVKPVPQTHNLLDDMVLTKYIVCSVAMPVTTEHIIKGAGTIKDAVLSPEYEAIDNDKGVELCDDGVKITYDVYTLKEIKVKVSDFNNRIDSWAKRGIDWTFLNVE